LGVSERTFRRWRDRYDEEGGAGLLDRRLKQGVRQADPAPTPLSGTSLYVDPRHSIARDQRPLRIRPKTAG
jgi:hypothetical protein